MSFDRPASALRLLFIVLPLAAVFSHRAFAPLTLLALAAVDWRRPLEGAAFSSARPYWAGAALIAVTTAASALWSPRPDEAHWAWRLGLAFALATIAHGACARWFDRRPDAAARVAAAVAWSAVAMGALLSFEALTGGMLRRLTPPVETGPKDLVALGRGATLLMLLVWPARQWFAADRPRLAWLVLALAAAPATMFTIETNAAMLAAGAAAYGLVRLRPAAARALVSLWVSLGMALVWLTPIAAAALPLRAVAAQSPALPDSWLQRLHIYARAGDAIREAPFGLGVGAARAMRDAELTVEIGGQALNTMSLHPHNLFLHVWLELGILGAIGLTLLLLGVRARLRMANLSTATSAGAAAVVAGLIVTASTEWSLWQVWRLAIVFIAAIALGAVQNASPRVAPAPRG